MPTEGLEFYRKRTYLSITELAMFARCPRKYFYQAGCGVVPETHIALRYGEALHAAIPTLLATGDLGKSMSEFSAVWKDGDSEDDNKRNTHRALVTLEDLHQKTKDNRVPFDIQEPPGGLTKIDETTSPFEIPFVIDIGLDVPLVGKIDSWAKDRKTGEYWALEYKTTSNVPSTFLRNFEINHQAIGYPTILSTLSDVKVCGTYVIAMQSAVRKVETAFQPVVVSDKEKESFIEWARWWGSLLLACESRGEWPKNLSACTPYGQFGVSGFTCDYAILCKSHDWTDLKGFFRQADERYEIKE